MPMCDCALIAAAHEVGTIPRAGVANIDQARCSVGCSRVCLAVSLRQGPSLLEFAGLRKGLSAIFPLLANSKQKFGLAHQGAAVLSAGISLRTVRLAFGPSER
jgi:hypothetical protein